MWYRYKDPEWRACGSLCVKKHLEDTWKANLEPSVAARVTVEEYSTSAITPFNSLAMEQSARGYKAHYLVKGLQFEDGDEADGLGLVPAKPVELVTNLPDGTTDESGLVPNLVPTKFRLYVPAVRAKTMPADVTGKFGGNDTAVW